MTQANYVGGGGSEVTHDTSLKEWLGNCNYSCLLIKVAKAHDGGVAAVAVNTAHDTLVITEEEDGKAGDAVDSDEERTLLVLAGYIVARDLVHGCCCGPVGLGCQVGWLKLAEKRVVCRAEGWVGGVQDGEVVGPKL